MLILDTAIIQEVTIIKYVINKDFYMDINFAINVNENYTSAFFTLLTSILENSNLTNKYYLFVLTNYKLYKDKKFKKILNKFKHKYKNLEFEILNIEKQIILPSSIKSNTPISLWKLYLPLLNFNLKIGKILYIDVEMIACKDIAELYNEDITNYNFAACRDIYIINLAKKNTTIKDLIPSSNISDMTWEQYIKNILNLPSIDNYINSDVLLINLENICKAQIAPELINYISSNQLIFPVQDVLNKFNTKSVKILNSKWNFPSLNQNIKEKIKPYENNIGMINFKNNKYNNPLFIEKYNEYEKKFKKMITPFWKLTL